MPIQEIKMFLSQGNNPEPVDENSCTDSGSDEDDIDIKRDKVFGKIRDLNSNHLVHYHNHQNDLSLVMRLPLLIGSLWGIPPLVGFQKTGKKPQSSRRWLYCRTFISLLIVFFISCNTLFIGLNFCLQFSCQKSIGDTIQKATGVWFYSTGLFVYLFFILRCPKSTEYCLYWRKICRKIRKTMIECPHLARDMNLICFIIILSAIGENIFFHIYSMRTGNLLSKIDKGVTLDEFLQDFFASNQYMSLIFNYNPVISSLLLLTNKCTLFAWNYGDIVIIMMSRAIYSRFVGLNQYLNSHLDLTGPLPTFQQGAVSWKTVRRNFLLIIKLLDKADKIFYPLVWISYATNIVFVCNQLFLGIRNTSIKTIVHRTYITWSLIHLIFRTLAVNIFAARINENAHKISKILQFSSPQEYDDNIRRLEGFLTGRVIGITANGIFVVTRYFILMIISAIFTLEVVLLQNSP